MNCKDLISIVLPVYNGEAYLSESIQSILNQTYANFELIIVNDCSSDNTEQIVKDFISKDGRITLINNKENQRLPRTLNIGFNIAKGRYLTWTSDDNIYHPTALEKMLTYLKCHLNTGMVYTDMCLIDKDGKVIGKRTSKDNDYFKYNCIGACFLYKRECKEAVGEYNPERFLVEDYDYWLRISQKFKIGHIQEFLYDYRFHEKSLSFSKMYQVGKRLSELKCEYLEDIVKHLEQQEVAALLFEIAVYSDNVNSSEIQELRQYVVENIDWIFNRKKNIEDNKVWLFGAGAIGLDALNFIGKDKVIGYLDNNEEKAGTYVGDKIIYELSYYVEAKREEPIVISTDVRNAYYIAQQLNRMKIYNYVVFYDLLTE